MSEKPKGISRLRGTLPTSADTDPTNRLRGDLANRLRIVAKVETLEGFIKALGEGSKFESTEFKYEVTGIKGKTVATKKFDKSGKFLATQTFDLGSLWDYYQEGRISLSK